MKPEILAPAGSMDALKAAIYAGADAVYLAGTKFGARAYADNFDESALIEAIKYSHIYGVKVYLTVNTLFRNDEIDELYDYILPYYEAGLDAVIVQDFGVLYYLHRYFPDLPIHASTQMTITCEYAYSVLKQYGVSRIVPARELNIEEIRQLKNGTETPEVEVFVQGALCYCYSGQCLMSSMLGGRSGNRGRCAQTCRLPYRVYDSQGNKLNTEGDYVLSPKDLCGLEMVPSLIEAGVDSFKIEGRMKKPEYVAACVRAYRKAVDAWFDGSFSSSLIQRYREEMAEVFNRGGFTKGYFEQKNGKDMMSVSNPGNVGVTIGRIEEIKKNQITVKLQKDISKGDILFLEDNISSIHSHKQESNQQMTGITLTSNVEGRAGNNVILNTPRSKNIRRNQIVRRMYKASLMNELGQFSIEERPIPIHGRVVLKEGLPAAITLSCEVGGKQYTIKHNGGLVEKASSKPICAETVRNKIEKTGNTRYYFQTLDIDLSDHIFISVKALKDLRRDAIAMLEEAVISEKSRTVVTKKREDFLEKENFQKKQVDTCVIVSKEEQYHQIRKDGRIQFIYLDLQYLKKDVIIDIISNDPHCYVVLPPILRGYALQELHALWDVIKQCAAGIMVRNIDELAYLKRKGYDGEIVTDYSLYVMNDYAAVFVKEQFPEARLTLPVELNRREWNQLKYKEHNTEVIVYSYQQLMVSTQCLQNTLLQCDHGNREYLMKDRYQKTFFSTNICKYCYSLIYNGLPTVLYDVVNNDSDESITKRLHFTKETAEEIKEVLHAYFEGDAVPLTKTRGHYGRGVE